jgi:hypothetical protein
MRSMASILLLAIIVGAAFMWVKRTRAARERWLSKLALPGVWQCDAPNGPWVLEFAGEASSGRYIERSGRATERGSWRLLGNAIELESESGTRTYDLRLFDNGSIGIDGPGRERRIYVRQRSNVVPLRKRQ